MVQGGYVVIISGLGRGWSRGGEEVGEDVWLMMGIGRDLCGGLDMTHR